MAEASYIFAYYMSTSINILPKYFSCNNITDKSLIAGKPDIS